MCGLVGIAGDLAFKDEIVMKRMFLADFFRGQDSTGLAAVRTAGNVLIAKVASHPIDLFDMTRFKTALTGSTSKVFIGHNRAATRGATSSFNAHPFTYEHITGAHNGTLTTASHKALEDAIGEKFDVDSQALFKAIAVLGIKEAISLCEVGRTSTDGAWALTWYDSKEDSLNFLRNKHRPLWHAFDKDGKRVLWASEWPMISASVKLNPEAYDLFSDDDGCSFFYFEEDLHYKFDLTELKAGGGRPKPVVKTIKGKEPASAYSYNDDDPFQMGFHGDRLNTGGASGGTTTSQTLGTGPANTRPLHMTGDASSPFAGMMSKGEFNLWTTDTASSIPSCSWCHEPIVYEEVGHVVLERVKAVIGPCCSGNKNYNKFLAINMPSL